MTGPAGGGRGPVAILAGSGLLPALVADRLARAGRDHRILAFRGFAEASLRARADATIDLLDLKRAACCLQDWRPSAVTLAGGVARPKPGAALNALHLIRNRDEIGHLFAAGDDHLLRGVVRLIEEQGYPVVGVHEIAPELLAAPGIQGSHRPGAAEERSIAHGMRLLADLSPYDIGQAAVVVEERVIAVEGPEGTDRMLARVGRLLHRWPWERARRGVLVKAPKRGQDLRVDLPAIGPRTLVRAARAGLRGVAVASGATLVLDLEETVSTADRLGLFLAGVDGPAERDPLR